MCQQILKYGHLHLTFEHKCKFTQMVIDRNIGLLVSDVQWLY